MYLQSHCKCSSQSNDVNSLDWYRVRCAVCAACALCIILLYACSVIQEWKLMVAFRPHREIFCGEIWIFLSLSPSLAMVNRITLIDETRGRGGRLHWHVNYSPHLQAIIVAERETSCLRGTTSLSCEVKIWKVPDERIWWDLHSAPHSHMKLCPVWERERGEKNVARNIFRWTCVTHSLTHWIVKWIECSSSSHLYSENYWSCGNQSLEKEGKNKRKASYQWLGWEPVCLSCCTAC